VWPGVESTITLPSPNTSLSSGNASTLPTPLIQRANGAGLARAVAGVFAVGMADADVHNLHGFVVELGALLRRRRAHEYR
jgi:hypothetical protein